MEEQYCMAYVTAGDQEEATRLARAIVGDHLAACANIHGPITAVFHWEGQVETGPEYVVIFKTRRDLVPRLTERVCALHSYDCPCVATLPIDDGNPEFLNWIGTETVQD